MQPATVKRYSSTITLLLLFVIRIFLKTPLQNRKPYVAHLSKDQEHAIKSLIEALPSRDSDVVVTSIQAVVLSLFKHEMEDPRGDHLFSCVTHFIILSSVTTEGSFKPASDITPLLAMLTHAARAALLGYHYELRNGPNGRLPWP